MKGTSIAESVAVIGVTKAVLPHNLGKTAVSLLPLKVSSVCCKSPNEYRSWMLQAACGLQ